MLFITCIYYPCFVRPPPCLSWFTLGVFSQLIVFRITLGETQVMSKRKMVWRHNNLWSETLLMRCYGGLLVSNGLIWPFLFRSDCRLLPLTGTEYVQFFINFVSNKFFTLFQFKRWTLSPKSLILFRQTLSILGSLFDFLITPTLNLCSWEYGIQMFV